MRSVLRHGARGAIEAAAERLGSATAPMKTLELETDAMARLAASDCSACGVPWTNHLGIAGTCAENKRLRDIIRRASTKFCEDGTDGAIAAVMFTILGESSKPNASDQLPRQ